MKNFVLHPRTVVSGDSDGAIIGRKVVLRLHDGGQRQQQEERQQLRGAGDSDSRKAFLGRSAGEGELVLGRAHVSPLVRMLPGHEARVKREDSLLRRGFLGRGQVWGGGEGTP